MAFVFCDSFDHYATSQITQKWTSNSGLTIQASQGRNSTQALLVNANDIYAEKALITSGATAIVGVGFKPINIANANGTRYNLAIRRAGTNHIYLAPTSLGAINAYRGDGTLLGTTVAGVLSTGNYTYIELKVLLHDSTGTLQIVANSISVLSLTGQDTANGAATWDSVLLGQIGAFGTGDGYYFDDLYVCDGSGSNNNDFLGPIRVMPLYADGAGNSTDFTPSAGSNYQNVDELLTDSDTTYNSASTPGDHDTYTYGAIGVTGSVKAVQTNLMVRSDGAGSETVAPMIRIGGTDYEGTAVGISTSYLDKTQVYDVSPATSIAWTVSEIDGAEFGAKLVS